MPAARFFDGETVFLYGQFERQWGTRTRLAVDPHGTDRVAIQVHQVP
jgi:hypothetical protein